MTFTELVPGVKARPQPSSGVSLKEARAFGEALRRLHQALRAYRGALQGSRQLYEDIRRLLDHIHAADARQRDRLRLLRDRLQSLRAAVFESSLPTQALHGDVSISNLLHSADRLIWNDFEDTFRGPVHWDLASAVGSLRVRGAEPLAVQELLFTYGWDNARELDPFLAAQDVYDEGRL